MGERKMRDAGQELTQNRRATPPAIGLSDFLAMTPTLRSSSANKLALWKRPDYQQLVAAGACRSKTRLLKAFYESVPGWPAGSVTPEDYAAAVVALRDAAMSWVVSGAGEAIEGDATNSAPTNMVRMAMDAATQIMYLALGDKDGESIEEWKARDADMNDPRRRTLWACSEGRVEWFCDWRLGYELVVPSVEADLERGWPKPQAQWERCGLQVVSRDSISIHETKWGATNGGTEKPPFWLKVGDRFFHAGTSQEEAEGRRAQLKPWLLTSHSTSRSFHITLGERQYESREAAIQDARRLARGTRSKKALPKRGLFSEGVMEGGGRCPTTATPEAFIETFGLKALNWGNWVTSGERGAHLAACWNSLHDLAEAIGACSGTGELQLEMVGAYGSLGLAIGAQGRGLEGATGHFIAGVNEANVTRLRPLGVLAHEFAHFIDHHMSTVIGNAAGDRAYLSDRVMNMMTIRPGKRPQRSFDTWRASRGLPALGARMAAVMNLLLSTEPSGEEIERYRMSMVQKYRASIADDLGRIKKARPDMGREMDRLESELMETGCPSTDTLRARPEMRARFVTTRRRIRKLQLDSGSRMLLWDARGLFEVLDASDETMARPLRKHARYYMASLREDDGRQGAYWSVPHEMFARAFEAWVAHRLKTLGGRRNDYLCKPQWESFIKLRRGVVEVNPELSPDEAAAIDSAMQALMRELTAALSAKQPTMQGEQTAETAEPENESREAAHA